MATITMILGMERFNAHIWSEVERSLRADGVDVQLLRFHDGHVERRDPELVAAIARADALFITLINMHEQAAWLAEQTHQHQPPVVFAFESMPEVMALTRVGEYRVSGGRGAMPKPMQMVVKLLTRGRDEDTLYAYTKLSKITAKLLPLMPAKLHDFRTWLSVNLYWNQPDPANLAQMVRLILRDCLHQSLDVAPVRTIATMGCFHPASDELFPDPAAYVRWARRQGHYKPGQPLVALIIFRKHIIQRQRYHADLIAALEARGLAVLPIFVSGIELHVAIREWVIGQPVDLLINTMGFPIVGGPAGSTQPGRYHDKASALLAELDVPYMVAQPLQMQDEQEWHEHGVVPMQAVIMYDLPEMDGSVAPVALGAIRDQRIVTTPDRVARAAEQAAGWVRLRRTTAAERRVALVVYNYPPGLGKLGTAAMLDVPASLHALLVRLQAEGYAVHDVPPTVEDMARRLAALEGGDGGTGVTINDYRQITPAEHANRVDRYWGSPPGDIAPVDRDSIRIDGMDFGNVFVGVQPPMGVPGDPMRMLFDRDFVPHHQYVAFYRWLKDVWHADAVVHVGMHGTAEWMPGLQLGLTAQCWPDLLLGSLPHLYLYPLNNPAEAAIAKRRGYAATISHAIPPYARAGLYKQLALLRRMLAEHDGDAREPSADDVLGEALVAFGDVPRLSDETAEQYVNRVRTYLDELEQRLILDGLHVFGDAPRPERVATLLEATLDVGRNDMPGLAALLARAGVAPADVPAARAQLVRRVLLDAEPAATVWREIMAQGGGDHTPPPAELDAMLAHGGAVLDGLAACPGELDALVHALGGGFVLPATGADPVRAGAAALPSGRNIHGIDPWRLPSAHACERGEQMATMLLGRHEAEHGAYPQTVALSLWALDTIKTEGESIAAVLALVGARPERDGQGKIWRYELIPLAELGRPRIDVLLDISSIFRDTFQMSLDLLDDLFRRAAAAPEPADQNFVRAHTLHMEAQGVALDQATARIFTQRPGTYGTGVDERIEESAWETVDELADTYTRRNGYTYGGRRGGTAAPAVLRGMLGTVEHVFQAIDSVEYGLTDMQHYYGHSGAMQLAARHERGCDVPLSYAESFTGAVKLATAPELLRIEARTKLLNPRWYEGMLAHGYAGAAEIGNRFTYLLGWSAVSDIVEPWVFDAAAATFVLDDGMRERLEQANGSAARNAVARLLEAHGRGLWPSDEATIARLQELYGNLEDQLEGAVNA
jgi:magnesium chelatase subunit H